MKVKYSVIERCSDNIRILTAAIVKKARSGHPELNVAKGVENTSGPHGQGHAMAFGADIAERFLCASFSEKFGFTYESEFKNIIQYIDKQKYTYIFYKKSI